MITKIAIMSMDVMDTARKRPKRVFTESNIHKGIERDISKLADSHLKALTQGYSRSFVALVSPVDV